MKGKVKNISTGDSIAQDGKKKNDMRKFKCFSCHKFGYYASQNMHMKKGGNEMQPDVATLEKVQMDEFAKTFEQTKFLLVSQTSLGTISDGAWLIDSGATCHMTGSQEVF
jgi:hypothetical protein